MRTGVTVTILNSTICDYQLGSRKNWFPDSRADGFILLSVNLHHINATPLKTAKVYFK